MTDTPTTPETAPVTAVPVSTAIESIRRNVAARRWVSVITEDGRALLVDRAASDPEQYVLAELLARNIEPVRAALEEDPPALLAEIDRLHALIDAPHPLLAELAVLFTRHRDVGRDHPDGTGGDHARQWADHMVTQVTRRGCAGELTWADLIETHAAVVAARQTRAGLRAELLQTAVTALLWVDALDRRGEGGPR